MSTCSMASPSGRPETARESLQMLDKYLAERETRKISIYLLTNIGSGTAENESSNVILLCHELLSHPQDFDVQNSNRICLGPRSFRKDPAKRKKQALTHRPPKACRLVFNTPELRN